MTSVLTWFHMPVVTLANCTIAATVAMTTKATINPYSIAVAPVRSANSRFIIPTIMSAMPPARVRSPQRYSESVTECLNKVLIFH